MTDNIVSLSTKRLQKKLDDETRKKQEKFNELVLDLNSASAQVYLNEVIEPILAGKGEVVDVEIPIIANAKDGKQFIAIANAILALPDDSIELIMELEPDSSN